MSSSYLSAPGGRLLPLLLALLLAISAWATEAARKVSFDLAAGPAEKTLKQFAAQSGCELVFASQGVAAVPTKAARGEFTPREALDLMLAGTGLVAAQDTKTGAFAVSRTPSRPNDSGAAPTRPDRDHPAEPTAGPVAAPSAPLPPPRLPASVPTGTGGDDPIVLSPFVTTVESDVGYLASTTLAGSRLRTPLKDVAAQISVFTPELMSDLGLTNLEEALMYSTNADSYLEWSPGGDVGANRGVWQLDNTNVARGLGALTTMREFFPTNFATDNYNSERLTIASGPNSILFGLGSPAGVADSSLKRAQFRNSFSFGARVDNFDGWRTQLDLNRVLVPKRIALRFAVLRNNNRTFRPGTNDLNDRLYGTLTFQPWTRTTLRISGEWIQRDASRAAMVLPRDWISPWWDAGKKTFNNFGISTTSAATAAASAMTAQGLSSQVLRYGANLTYFYGATAQTGSLMYLFNTAGTDRINKTAPQVEDRLPEASLNRPDIIDPNFNTYGAAIGVEQRGKILNAFLEQRLTRNLVVELGYARENYRQRWGNFVNTPSLYVRADPNQYLPDGKTPNPDLGKIYLESDSLGNNAIVALEDLRATLAYEPDLRRSTGWLRHLGHYRFGGLFENAERENKSQNTRFSTLDNPSIYSTAQRNNATDASRILNNRYYLSGNEGSRPAPFAGGLNTPEPLVLAMPGGEQVTYRMWTQDGAWGPPSGSKQRTRSLAATGQGYWLDDRILGYAGWRQDRVRRAQSLSPEGTVRKSWPQTTGGTAAMGLYPLMQETRYADWDFAETGATFNWGAILRPWKMLQFHYSRSENFAIQVASWFTPYGVPIPGSNGEGRDYGFSLHGRDNRWMLRFNVFRNSQLNSRPDNIVTALSTDPKRIEERIWEVAPGTPMLGIDLNRYTRDNYSVTNSLVARGQDVEFIATPSPRWRIFGSVGRQKAQTQIDDTWWRWVAERLPVWQKFGRGWDVETINDIQAITIHAIYDDWVKNYRNPLVATSGKLTDGQREWRGNLMITHNVTAGWLKGVSVGGGGRYRSAAYVGYPVTTLPDGNIVLDLTRPYHGKPEIYLDGFLKYALRSVPFFDRKARASVQLNVRNLADAKSLLVSQTMVDGSPKMYRYQSPRQIILSVDFNL